ncbi:MAG: penicillin acylase family protein [Acidobacteria bacterium]|nr:penicillin acylase family protein [Acidobacteriota bacterium]
MTKFRRFVGVAAGILLLLASLAVLAGWFWWRQTLPQLDGEARLPGLKQSVTVDRDHFGVPRIRAESLEDLVVAQGYVTAQDRLWQMDLLRRIARGDLSEIFGEQTLQLDRQNRILGLRVAAEKAANDLDPKARAVVESYAKGVNRYIEERRGKLPIEFQILRYEPRPWTVADSLVIGGYMWEVLTNTWEMELERGKLGPRVGPEREKDMYEAQSSMDHFLIGVAPSGAKTTIPKKVARNNSSSHAAGEANITAAADALWPIARAFLQQSRIDAESALGSNNWVVDGTHTYSGKPILANDTHLQLGVPSLWHMVHLTAPGWNVKGFALPGAPLVIIGHNERIAWGFTNNCADVQDLFVETFNPENASEYRVNGKWVQTEVRKETISVRGRAAQTLDVVITRHGPIVHREGHSGYALKWVATEPGGLNFGVPWLGQANNWTEFREVMRNVYGPAQNAVYADVDGNIGYFVGARIPVRKKGDGGAPAPGDTDEYEWTGYIPFDELPQILNPPGGIIATANARIAGPDYKHHLTHGWIAPYRTERIYQRLAENKKFTPEDFISIQTDIISLPHKFFAEQLLAANKVRAARDPRTQQLIQSLAGWDGVAESDSMKMTFVEFTRRALLRNVLRGQLGNDAALYRPFRATLFLENVLRERPERWLEGSEYKNFDEMLIASADQAVRNIEAASEILNFENPGDPANWRWGRYIQLQMLHPMARSGFLKPHWSMGDLPQKGTSQTVKQTGPSIGPAMRFVADMSNLDNSLMNITMGESGQYLSEYYSDQFQAWYEGFGLKSPFTDAAVEKARVHRLTLKP